jgi:N-methylhydantoinase B
MDAVALSIFVNRVNAVCEQMGAVLRRAAFSPNIRDRLDFSCALFDRQGELCAQAAHIPVHLGSMAYAMGGIVQVRDWSPGDLLAVNDPFLGGTHLPDVTLIAPFFLEGRLAGFVANRAHHADIGASSPGSMPISHRLEEEGVIIPPTLIGRRGRLEPAALDAITGRMNTPALAAGDFAAQAAACRAGLSALEELATPLGGAGWNAALAAVNHYAARLAGEALRAIPDGVFRFSDCMDDDGAGTHDLPLCVALEARDGCIEVDFTGSSAQVEGNVNCPLSVTAAAVLYVFRCLMPQQTPASAGCFRNIRLNAPAGSLVNARPPAAVAAGNVETSSRIVDVVMGALAQALPDRLAAASQGTMNNVAMGSRTGRRWDYYETLGGGLGAHPRGPGLDGRHSHMTNTLNTPVEVVEMTWPLRLREYALRRGSGGIGRHSGGDGVVREYEFLAPAEVSLITERRRHRPWGLAGGRPGAPGRNCLNGRELAPKAAVDPQAGDPLRNETPGGGGWGESPGP